MTPLLSLTESQTMKALRAFLLSVLPPGTEVVRGQVNRVPEPKADNFVVFWPIRQERLETNEVVFYDNIVVGSIAGAVLTITGLTRGSVPVGGLLLDKAPHLTAGTIIGTQLTGPAGGIGTYNVSPSQTVASETMYAGIRADMAAMELVVQLDIHGSLSSDNTRIIETLFRSEFGCDSFTSSGYAVAPLYSTNPREMPFINNEQQYEYRWTMDAHLQANPVISTNAQFAEEILPQVIEAAVIYTGPVV